MTEEELYAQIVSTTKASISMLAEYLGLVIARASSLPKERLLARSGKSQFREPIEPGELIAAKIFHVLVMQDNISPNLQEIRDLAQQLTADTDDPALWETLSEKVRGLERCA